MAVHTLLDIYSHDAQGRDAVLSFRIKPAAFGATTLPTAAKIEAVIDALFGSTVFSTNIVDGYAVRVVEDAPGAVGGNGAVAVSSALRVRSEIATNNWLFSIPGLNEAYVVFDPTNPNSVSVSSSNWDALRAALVDAAIAVSAPEGTYAAVITSLLAQTATTYDGKRSPMRPR